MYQPPPPGPAGLSLHTGARWHILTRTDKEVFSQRPWTFSLVCLFTLRLRHRGGGVRHRAAAFTQAGRSWRAEARCSYRRSHGGGRGHGGWDDVTRQRHPLTNALFVRWRRLKQIRQGNQINKHPQEASIQCRTELASFGPHRDYHQPLSVRDKSHSGVISEKKCKVCVYIPLRSPCWMFFIFPSSGFTLPETLFYLLITLSGDKSDPTTLGCVWNVHYTYRPQSFTSVPPRAAGHTWVA